MARNKGHATPAPPILIARDKVGRAAEDRIKVDAAIQDGTDLVDHIIEQITATIIDPLETRIETLERVVAGFTAGQVQSIDVELARLLAGSVDVEGVFLEAQVGAPVLIAQSRPLDDLEGLVLFAGEVIDVRTLRIVWQAASLPPRKVRLSYIIGSIGE